MNTIPLLLTLVSAFLWGISPIVAKSLLQKFHHYTIMMVFPVIYVACLLVIFPFYGKEFLKDMEKVNQKDVIMMLFQGVGVLFFGNIIYYYVLKDNNSSIVTALEGCAPLFTLVFAYYLLNEKISFIGLIGILLIILGVICVSQNDKKTTIFEYFYVRD